MQIAKVSVLVVITGVFGYWLAHEPARPPQPVPPQPAPTVVVARPTTPLPDRDEARTVVDAPAIEAPRQSAAFAKAEAIVQAAIADRRWTGARAKDLHAQLAGLDRAQLESLLSTLLPAINRGEIKVERGLNGPLF